MCKQPDTSTRKSIQGARVPLTLLAVHKTRVDGLHKSALWVSATASSGCEHESSWVEGGSSVGEPLEGSHVHTRRFTGLDHLSGPLTFTSWHTSLEATSELQKSLHPHRVRELHHSSPLSRPNSGASQSGRFSWRNKTVVFLRPLSHFTRNTFMRNNWP
jgi:hypothetical protein